MSTPVGVIRKFVKALTETKKTGTAAADEAFKAVGAKSYSAFKSKFNTDKASVRLMDDFLKEKCGIRLTNDDTGAITGSDAGGKTVKTDESIVPETATAVNLTNAQYKSFTRNGITFNIDYDEIDDDEAEELDDFGYSAATYLAKQKLVVKNLYNWWIPEACALINESFGSNFTDKLANIYKFEIEFENNGGDVPVELDFDYNNGYAFEVTLRIDPMTLYTITANDKNGKLPDNNGGGYGVVSDSYANDWNDAPSAVFTNYLDRLILQSMAEVALKANIPNFNKLPLGVRSGLIELVGGYDSGLGGDTNFDYDFYADNSIDYDGMGYATMRYLAKQYSDGLPDGLSYNSNKTALTVTTEFTEKTLDLANFAGTVKNVNANALKKGIKIIGNAKDNSISGGSGADTISGGAGKDKLFGNAGNDSLSGGEGNDTLSGGKGNDKLLGGAGNDSLSGGEGADTLNGGAGNDTLTGGKGNDVFIYSAGNDVITDYATGDKISLGAAVSKASVSGSDVVLTIGKGSLKIKKGKGATLSMINSKGKSFSTIISGSANSTLMTVTDSTSSPVTIDSAVKIVDASKRTKAVKITGNSSANKIIGGSGNDSIYGGAGNDTLDGGKGNDSLWGDKGADVFLYSEGEGKDVIYGFDNSDMILITDGFSTSYDKSKKEIYFKVGSTSNALTLKNYSATTFNVNGYDYKISNSKLVKK